jgi:predicted TIM-barrel fold metal-dependent hydrolase
MLGTDYPYTLGNWTAVDKVEALACPDAEKEAILGGNARRLLRL